MSCHTCECFDGTTNASMRECYLNTCTFVYIALETVRIVLGSCHDGGQTYYLLQFYSLGSPSSTHNDVSISQCVSSCAFSTSGGLFKHNSDTRLCECYNLPQTLTNVQTGAPVRIAGKLYTLVLVNQLNYHTIPINFYIDLSKDFDSLRHDILTEKRAYYNVKNKKLKLLKSYFSNQKQYVKLNDITSTCTV